MAKKQTRRSFSMQRPMYEAIKLRAHGLGKSASQYLHELVSADMLAAGFKAPKHCSHSEVSSRHAHAINEARRATRDARLLADLERAELPKQSPIAKARAAGEAPRVFKPKLALVDPRAEQDPPPEAFEKPLPLRDPHCEWCGEVAGRKRPLGEHGMHEKCAVERTRVESRTEARRRYA